MVGDMNGQEKGTACRLNEGKTPYDLLPLKVVVKHLQWDGLEFSKPNRIIKLLADWQGGEDGALDRALEVSRGLIRGLPSLAGAARVLDYGRKKYSEWNWARGFQWSVPLACAVRHCIAILNGDEDDEESGLPHMAHVQCNLLMLLTFRENYPEGDDRPVEWLGGS